MTLSSIFRQAEQIIADNSPLILTAIGVTGTVTTAIFSGKASFKAGAILDNEAYIRELHTPSEPPMTTKEKVSLTWKLYIPAVTTGVLTISCIIAANRIGTRRAAAIAAAYSISEKAFVEYKEKVLEKVGQNKTKQIREELAQDRINANPVSSREVIITGNGDVLCYDSITGRYFESNIETLRKAENDINRQIMNDMYVTLHEFYVAIGLPSTLYSTEVGWNTDTMLELQFSTTLSEDNRPCIAIEYAAYPIRNYYTLQ